MRIGQGYDIHIFVENRKFILGGVEIPYEKGLLGHSDADALIHSIIDSIFGALNLGDIGEHFPDSDIKYKDISSLELLTKTGEILKEKGYKIINIDSTIILEKPKLSPYKKLMAKNISAALNIKEEDVSIKGKTKEKQDSAGSGKSVEVYSVCLIEKNL